MAQRTTRRDNGSWFGESLPRQDVLDTIERAKQLLSPEALPESGDIRDSSAASVALDSAWQAARRALDRGDVRAGSPELIRLLTQIRRDRKVLHDLEVRQRSKSMRVAWEALGRFRGISTVEALVDLCPKVMAALGFDRTMISTIHDEVWTPRAAYFAGDPAWAREIVRSGRENPQSLTTAVPEHRLLRREKCILVSDPRNNETMYKALVQPSVSRAYVAAAVRRDGQVAAFLHADCYFRDRVVDEFDLDVLGLFADGFGYILERAVLLERADSIRAEVGKLTAGAAAAIDAFIAQDADVGEMLCPDDRSAARTGPEGTELTRREIEVLQHMAAGRSNGSIAETLVISPATVKSHVKHILRKLGAANRAEAVSCWFNGFVQ
ncbi:helix-turn-helix transcriptional regulator [Amycolatopsis acidiphila]|nr:helix-turn-helix transcriptional regulator [Amycolatopsis acidiphila]UIJ63961.1 helix-turn-helix transcriptional regulator [Amycolatopsis acidiphila]